MSDKIIIFDTTLRDGEQAPGASLNIREKLEVARILKRLNVDVIEAGFPIASPGDFEAVKEIAQEIQGPAICGLARATEGDIVRAGEAVKYAQAGRIHTFIATSPIHMEFKLKKTPQEVLKSAVEAVKLAKTFVNQVEFSPEDSSRTELPFLAEIVEAVIEAGATTVNIPDTVGYGIPQDYANQIKYLKENVPNINKAVISVHCHNDLGLAVANSLAAIEKGARQIECTINGIGERAGNCSLEEVVMAIKTRNDYFKNFYTEIDTTQIMKASKLVSHLTGFVVQPNKAIVGDNAFAHEAGIHQHGVLTKRQTYEIIDPKDIGLGESKLVLGKHSGKHAFKDRLEQLGYSLSPDELQSAFERFKVLADRKKNIFDEDLEIIVEESFIKSSHETYTLEYINISSGNKSIPTATLQLKKEEHVYQDAACGDGPVDAAYKTIMRITGVTANLLDYSLRSISKGQDAIGEVVVKIGVDDKIVTGKGVSTDIIEASARAFLDGINKILKTEKKQQVKKGI
ncbi:2-isopropylmalate synthase [bacterium]|nr:2-isopropylmalate synthase [bacterium]MCP5462680.1 2-isopropylmalate synthase [bacterium]